MIRTYKYPLLPTRGQRLIMLDILESQRQLWNAALQERISFYDKTGGWKSFFDQCKSLTQCRVDDPELALLPANLQRFTLKRLNASYNLFFSNIRKKKKVSLPRFLGYGRLNCFGWNQWQGVKIVNQRLKFKGMRSGLRINWHRPLPSDDIRSCAISRRLGRWWISFQVRVEPKSLPSTGKSCGLDMGIENLVALDNGEMIPNLEHLKVLERRKKKAQRRLARAKRGSVNRTKRKLELGRTADKIKRARSTHLRQIASRLVREYDTIAIEDLKVSEMLDKDKNHRGLNRGIANASFGLLRQYLMEKAESAARQIILVKAAYTSQTCPKCGTVKKKALAQRQHICPCGSNLHRDTAAAKIILLRGLTIQKTAA